MRYNYIPDSLRDSLKLCRMPHRRPVLIASVLIPLLLGVGLGLSQKKKNEEPKTQVLPLPRSCRKRYRPKPKDWTFTFHRCSIPVASPRRFVRA